MKESISKNEYLILKSLIILTASVNVFGISSKFIGGYNQAIREKTLSFSISDCYNFYDHQGFFVLFLLFTFLFLLSARKFISITFLSAITFAALTLSLLQATYLSLWFAEITNIEWNSTLIRPDIFDGILYFCFAVILFVQLKIIYRFTKEKFQAKISLK